MRGNRTWKFEFISSQNAIEIKKTIFPRCEKNLMCLIIG